MVIYVEYVLLDNFIMDFVIINMLEITYKYKFKKLNKVLTCLLGSLLSLMLPYIYNNILFLNFYRIVIAIIMVMLLKKYKNFKQFISYLILFFAYTFILGGLIFGIISMLKIDYTISGIMFYSFEFPVSVFVLIIYLCIKICKRVAIKITHEVNESHHLYPIKFYLNNKVVEGVGLYDTGNKLVCDGQGVSVISVSVLLSLVDNVLLEKIMLGKIKDSGLRECKYIEINGLSKNGNYVSFILDKICVNGCSYKDVRVAVMYKNFNKFDSILSSAFNLN